MGNVQMEAEQIRYKDSNGTYRNAQTAIAAALTGGGGSTSLADLTDTTITSPSNGQILQYDGTSSKWINAAGGSGATTLEALTDTDISTPSGGQVLTYDGTAEKWENAPIPAQSVDGLSDTTITTPTDGQVLTYDGTAEKWVNANGGSGASTLDGLTDTDITTPSNGQVLTYDSTSSKWVNASAGGGGSASQIFDNNYGDYRVDNNSAQGFSDLIASFFAGLDTTKITAKTVIRITIGGMNTRYIFLTPGNCLTTSQAQNYVFSGYYGYENAGTSNYFYSWFMLSFQQSKSTSALSNPNFVLYAGNMQTDYLSNTNVSQIAIQY